MSGTINALLDAAETRMRAGGYHAVSFRDLAEDLSIKSASVHYHFRRKEDLGAAVVARYTDNFLNALGEACPPGADRVARIDAVIKAFRNALTDADQICLCGVMGAEALGLPDPVRAEVRSFMRRCLDWLTDALGGDEDAQSAAMMIVATLEGAMILSVNLDDVSAFDRVAERLRVQIG